ncbi:addiction module antitoxin [Thioalkalivibrio denitrificans]|uniref:Addiction module antitoxin n=1 Tax=Thioalkalivibrio denitrificans TaxID=108003 RepID=A0A1V3NH41_9GAMM|nr:addiction module antitoxin [Thioalkalivibrio denitrificans]
MRKLRIPVPSGLAAFVDQQVRRRGYDTHNEYVCALIGRDQDRQRLRDQLLAGAASAPAKPAGRAYFSSLREHVRQATKAKREP